MQGYIGFRNYLRAFDDPHFLNSVLVTLNYTVVSVILSVVIGLIIALVLQKRSLVSTVLKACLILPYAMAPALKGYSWRFMLNPYYRWSGPFCSRSRVRIRFSISEKPYAL